MSCCPDPSIQFCIRSQEVLLHAWWLAVGQAAILTIICWVAIVMHIPPLQSSPVRQLSSWAHQSSSLFSCCAAGSMLAPSAPLNIADMTWQQVLALHGTHTKKQVTISSSSAAVSMSIVHGPHTVALPELTSPQCHMLLPQIRTGTASQHLLTDQVHSLC